MYTMIHAVDYSKVKVSKARAEQLADVISSWRTLWTAIKDLEESNDNLTYLSELLVCEARNPDLRADMLSRLHMRINGMRQRMEIASVYALAGIPPVVRTRKVERIPPALHKSPGRPKAPPDVAAAVALPPKGRKPAATPAKPAAKAKPATKVAKRR